MAVELSEEHDQMQQVTRVLRSLNELPPVNDLEKFKELAKALIDAEFGVATDEEAADVFNMAIEAVKLSRRVLALIDGVMEPVSK